MEQKLAKMEPSERMKQLNEFSKQIPFDSATPVMRFVRSGKEVLRMARQYEKDRSLEYSYVFYMKYLTLTLDKLPLHPGYDTIKPEERKDLIRQCKQLFPIVEKIKKELMLRYDDEFNKELARMEEERLLKEEHEMSLALQREAEDRRERERQLQLMDSKLRDRKEQWRDIQQHSHDEHLSHHNDQQPSHIQPTAPSSSDHTNHNSVATENRPAIPDRSTKPSSLLSGRSFMGDEKLRKVELPSDLVTRFLTVAEKNTLANVETCGILAGKMSQNSFRVTHILVPRQSGTSDSCTTQNEEQVFACQDKLDLITLGWIHTHPSQSAFMSSIDLHTHCSYQLMMQEAVAVVASPKFGEVGVYSLTPDYGLDYIANCRESGFHPHPSHPPLYEESPHVSFSQLFSIQIVDLRS